jgi:hypothetical protein
MSTKALDKSSLEAIDQQLWHFHDKHNFYDYSQVIIGDRVKSTINGRMGTVINKKTIEVHAMLPTDLIWVQWDEREISHPYPHQIAIDLTNRQQSSTTPSSTNLVAVGANN